MPASALQYAPVDFVLGVNEITQTLVDLASRAADTPNVTAGLGKMELVDHIAIENHAFNKDVDMANMNRIGSREP